MRDATYKTLKYTQSHSLFERHCSIHLCDCPDGDGHACLFIAQMLLHDESKSQSQEKRLLKCRKKEALSVCR